MTDALRRSAPIELSRDPRFAGRVRRLAATSVIALGLIWALASLTLEVPSIGRLALLAGWLLMPAVLVASLHEPRLRYLLVLPSASVTLALAAIAAWWLPPHPVAAAGWLLITVGVALGGLMGLWFWYRVVPVPAGLDAPFSRGRLGLIGLHVALIVAGIALAAVPTTIG